VGATFSRVGMSIPFGMIDELVNEFGPDLERKIAGKKENLQVDCSGLTSGVRHISGPRSATAGHNTLEIEVPVDAPQPAH
jgi:hypothetical protein